MQRYYDDEFGPVGYTITERENSIFVSIPIVSHTILAIMKKNTDPTVVINKIKIAIKNFEHLNKKLFVEKSDQV